MNLSGRQEWNFNSEHPLKRTAATPDELRIYEKLYGGCTHSMWTRIQDANGHRHATCDTCQKSVYLGREGNRWESGDLVLPDAAVQEKFLGAIPHTRYDDVNANKVFRDLEAAGWTCTVHTRGDLYACTMSKAGERFASNAHNTRAAAITEAAGQLLRGTWPR